MPSESRYMLAKQVRCIFIACTIACDMEKRNKEELKSAEAFGLKPCRGVCGATSPHPLRAHPSGISFVFFLKKQGPSQTLASRRGAVQFSATTPGRPVGTVPPPPKNAQGWGLGENLGVSGALCWPILAFKNAPGIHLGAYRRPLTSNLQLKAFSAKVVLFGRYLMPQVLC